MSEEERTAETESAANEAGQPPMNDHRLPGLMADGEDRRNLRRVCRPDYRSRADRVLTPDARLARNLGRVQDTGFTDYLPEPIDNTHSIFPRDHDHCARSPAPASSVLKSVDSVSPSQTNGA